MLEITQEDYHDHYTPTVEICKAWTSSLPDCAAPAEVPRYAEIMGRNRDQARGEELCRERSTTLREQTERERRGRLADLGWQRSGERRRRMWSPKMPRQRSLG